MHLNQQQVATFPKVKPYTGEILSHGALLRTSTVDAGPDRPISYQALLRSCDFGGFFHTAAEDNPCIQVQLAGENELTGIILVNRFEACSERQVPLKVSASSDGKTWKELGLFTKNQLVFQLDLENQKIRAKFIRIERPPVTGRREPFHLRNILVYGKRLS